MARVILESAQANRQPLLIYEMSDNKTPFALWRLALLIGPTIVSVTCLFLTPLVRPLTLRQLLIACIVPIIPMFYAWDGQASMPRIYALQDLDELLEGMDSSDYRWE